MQSADGQLFPHFAFHRHIDDEQGHQRPKRNKPPSAIDMDSGEVGAVQFFDNGSGGKNGDEHDNENRCDVTNVFHGNMISDYAAKVRKKTIAESPHVWRFWGGIVLINGGFVLGNNTNKGEEKVLFRLLNQSFMYFCNRKKVPLKVVYTPFKKVVRIIKLAKSCL